MDDFLKQMADILDEDTVREKDRLEDFDSWDSLAILSVISMADEKYGAIFSAREIKGATTIRALFDLMNKASTNDSTG